MIQNKDIENGPKYSSNLDENAKNDLRRSHFNLGNNRPDFETTFRAEYYDKSNLLPKENIDSKNIEKMLRAHNYEFGDDKPNYISEAADRYTKPNVNPNDLNKVNNQLLQKVIIILVQIMNLGIPHRKGHILQNMLKMIKII